MPVTEVTAISEVVAATRTYENAATELARAIEVLERARGTARTAEDAEKTARIRMDEAEQRLRAVAKRL